MNNISQEVKKLAIGLAFKANKLPTFDCQNLEKFIDDELDEILITKAIIQEAFKVAGLQEKIQIAPMSSIDKPACFCTTYEEGTFVINSVESKDYDEALEQAFDKMKQAVSRLGKPVFGVFSVDITAKFFYVNTDLGVHTFSPEYMLVSTYDEKSDLKKVIRRLAWIIKHS